MAEYSIYSWVNAALREMRFPPDREKVRQELWDHLLDRREDFKAQGMSEQEAEYAAARAMGDPAEVGRLLNEAHRPLLGWIWQASRIFLVAAAAVFVLSWFSDDFSRWRLLPDWELEWNGCPYEGKKQAASDVEVLLHTGAKAEAGVYDLTLDHGNWVIGQDSQRLLLGFRVRAQSLLDMDPVGFSCRLEAEDDLGNHYQARAFGVNDLNTDAFRVTQPTWRAPYLHLFFDPEDGVRRQWVRLYIPGTAFDLTVHADGRVTP